MTMKPKAADLQKQIADLTRERNEYRARAATAEREVASLRDRLARAAQSAVTSCAEGRAAGFRSGAFEALCPVSPQHVDAVAAASEHDTSGYLLHLTTALGEAHSAWCAKIRAGSRRTAKEQSA